MSKPPSYSRMFEKSLSSSGNSSSEDTGMPRYVKIILVLAGLLVVLAYFIYRMFMSRERMLVFYHAKWCPHCVKAMPAWEEAEKVINNGGKTKAKAVEESELSGGEEVSGFPTIRLYPNGTSGDYIEYNGDRSSADLIRFAESAE